MKIGLVSAILEDYDFKKMIDTVSEIGYECVEVACWPKAKAERSDYLRRKETAKL